MTEHWKTVDDSKARWQQSAQALDQIVKDLESALSESQKRSDARTPAAPAWGKRYPGSLCEADYGKPIKGLDFPRAVLRMVIRNGDEVILHLDVEGGGLAARTYAYPNGNVLEVWE